MGLGASGIRHKWDQLGRGSVARAAVGNGFMVQPPVQALALSLPRVSMASAVDAGDPFTPFHTLHPVR